MEKRLKTRPKENSKYNFVPDGCNADAEPLFPTKLLLLVLPPLDASFCVVT